VEIKKIAGAFLTLLILIFYPGALESKEATMTKRAIQTVHAPEAIGPYSQAIRVDHFLFLSGQIGINPETKRVVEGGVEPQTRQIFENIKAVLAEAGSDIDQVVKVTVFLKDMSNFKLVNSIYAQNFSEPYPARSAVAVRELPLAVDIEIEVVAVI
jgi:2-iminobutanoate/2-iminopropanoate deaminase